MKVLGSRKASIESPTFEASPWTISELVTSLWIFIASYGRLSQDTKGTHRKRSRKRSALSLSKGTEHASQV